jgi:hypothetical protein
MMDEPIPEQPLSVSAEVSAGKRPRKPFLLTGARLGNKVQLAQALLRSGGSQRKVAKDLSISVRSVGEIARRMGQAPSQTVTAPSGTQANPILPLPAEVRSGFDEYVLGDLQRVVRLSLGNITKEKAEQATLRDICFAVDKTLTRLEAIETRKSNLGAFNSFTADYGIVGSHSVSRLTLESKVTIESTSRTPQTAK